MSKTKIKAALSALNKAAKGAFKVLNEVTDGAFEGSPAEAEPTRYANEISQRLQKQYDHLEMNAQYDGMSAEEIAEQRTAEDSEARATLQKESAEKLRAFMAEKEVPEAELEEEFRDSDKLEEDFQNSDSEEPENGTDEPEV